MNNIYKILILMVSGVFMGCNPSQHSEPFKYDQSGSVLAIKLTGKPVQRINLRYDSIRLRQRFYEIPASGIVSLAIENKLVVTAPFDGKISFKNIAEQSINKGQAIASIQSLELVTLQQEYLEAKNQFDYCKEEYTRQGDLTVENATSMKKMQQAKRDFQSSELRFHAFALKLKVLGLNPQALNVNTLVSFVTVVCPIQGSTLKFTVAEGSYVHAGDPIAEISSSQVPLIELSVPEIYYPKIKIGNDVDCILASDTLNVHMGKVVRIQKEINPESREGIVHVQVNDTLDLIKGMGVQCSIHTGEESGLWVRSSAILNEHNATFVFIRQEGLLLKVPVKTGSTKKAETEISGLPVVSMDSVVVTGLKRLAPYFKIQ